MISTDGTGLVQSRLPQANKSHKRLEIKNLRLPPWDNDAIRQARENAQIAKESWLTGC